MFEHLFPWGVGSGAGGGTVQGTIGPTADGRALELEVECRTSRAARRGVVHPVRITPDWQLDSPHDLAAERVAMAFGGYCSCVALADRVVPALQLAIQLLTRSALPSIAPAADRGWIVGRAPEGCFCGRHFFATAAAAADHARSAAHLAHRAGTTERRFASLLATVSEAHDHFPAQPPAAGLAERVRDPGGLGHLWRAGVHPERVAELAGLVPGDEPLPVGFFLGVAFRPVDQDWLRATIARRADPDVATFLAWSVWAVNPDDQGRCGDWLALGVPSRDVEHLLRDGTPPDAAHELASELGWRPGAAASYLAAWARAGCRPTPAHVRLLDALGLDRSYHPSPAAINLLELTSCELPEPPPRTDLAVLLAAAGTRTSALRLLERGITDPFSLVSSGPRDPAPTPTTKGPRHP